jgi:HEAT repeat protein
LTGTTLLSLLFEVLAGALAGALAVLFGHGAWVSLRDRMYAHPLARARTALYSGDTHHDLDKRGLAELRVLPIRLRITLLSELSRSLDGAERGLLTRLARTTGVAVSAERLARSRFWWQRLRAARLLTFVDGDEILVLSLLEDPHPAVRAQTAEWAVHHPTRAVVEALIVNLEQPEAFCRFAAQDALLRLGPAAVAPLAAYLERAEGAACLPALDVAAGMAQPAFSRCGIRLSADENPEVRTRALALLGAIGGSDGVDAVMRRLDDPAAAVRAAAARAIGDLGHWPAAPAVAALLRDRSWDVRRAAGLALRDLGSPGHLLLRRLENDTNLFAADMARQVLDLPEPAAAHS